MKIVDENTYEFSHSDLAQAMADYVSKLHPGIISPGIQPVRTSFSFADGAMTSAVLTKVKP